MSEEDRSTGHAGSADVSDPLVGTVFHEKYRVLERLGVGGFGTVYRVRNLRLDTVEALKVIHRHVVLEESQLERFRQEAQLLRRLGMRSPHIPLVHDFDRDNEHEVWFFTLEYVPGTSLREVVARGGPLAVSRALSLVRQMCAALAVAHGAEKPVIHRDLKPDNVMVLTEEGEERVKILDFGIARILGETGFTSTQAGVHGSAGYIAPEQMEGVTDPRTDLFATGVTLHVMLTGRDPWLGKPVSETLGQGEAHKMLRQALFEEPVPLRSVDPDLPPDLEEVVLRLLRKEPEDRFASAAELDAALAGIESGGEAADDARRSVVATEALSARIRGLPRASRWMLTVAILALGLGFVAWPWLWPDGTDASADAVVSLENVRQRLAEGRVEQVHAGTGGELSIGFADGSRSEVAWGGPNGPLQPLLARIRRAGVPFETTGEARLTILTRGAGNGLDDGDLRVSVAGEGQLCDPCALSAEVAGAAGWYTARLESGDRVLDSVLVRHALLEGSRPADHVALPSETAVPERAGAAEVFLPAGLRTDLTLVLSVPDPLERDSLAALLEAAEEAYRRGAWTSPPGENLAGYLDRILDRDPTHPRALALRDSLTRSFERLIENARATGDAERVRQIAERCLEAVPDAAECQAAAGETSVGRNGD